MLFVWDQTQQSPEKIIAAYWGGLLAGDAAGEGLPLRAVPDDFANELLCGTVSRAAECDTLIRTHAEHWRLERMPAVDRNILRLAVFELLERQTPAAVVIDEALEVARRFSGEESVQFVNGVLDAVRRAI